MDVVLCLDFIEKKPLQILMSEEALKADVSKYATDPKVTMYQNFMKKKDSKTTLSNGLFAYCRHN